MADPPLPQIIRRSTLVDISLVASLMAAIAAGAVWTTSITLKQDQLRLDLEAVRASMDESTQDGWEAADMRAWVQMANSEAELWARGCELALSLPTGAIKEMVFPVPENSNGR